MLSDFVECYRRRNSIQKSPSLHWYVCTWISKSISFDANYQSCSSKTKLSVLDTERIASFKEFSIFARLRWFSLRSSFFSQWFHLIVIENQFHSQCYVWRAIQLISRAHCVDSLPYLCELFHLKDELISIFFRKTTWHDTISHFVCQHYHNIPYFSRSRFT